MLASWRGSETHSHLRSRWGYEGKQGSLCATLVFTPNTSQTVQSHPKPHSHLLQSVIGKSLTVFWWVYTMKCSDHIYYEFSVQTWKDMRELCVLICNLAIGGGGRRRKERRKKKTHNILYLIFHTNFSPLSISRDFHKPAQLMHISYCNP